MSDRGDGGDLDVKRNGTSYYLLWLSNFFSPVFLISVVILCSIMSLCTGSSWTTIGTIGVAFIGIGTGLEIPVGLTAGAIISGAYFGDKQSPVSDSTNFCRFCRKDGFV